MKREHFHLLGRWALMTVSLSALLFLAAGTTHVTSIRRYLLVSSTLLLITMLAIDPQLAKERALPIDAGADDGWRFATGFLSLITPTVAALSVGRLGTFFNVPISIRDTALGVFAIGSTLQAWTMIVNPFFSPSVRLQTERSQYVIQDGPYTSMRHPGYFAMSISVPAAALAIGSWLALVPAVAFVLLIQRRAQFEDEFLKKNLPGYADYARRVPARLMPRLGEIRGADEAGEERTCQPQ